jgi:hypothetical protein
MLKKSFFTHSKLSIFVKRNMGNGPSYRQVSSYAICLIIPMLAFMI